MKNVGHFIDHKVKINREVVRHVLHLTLHILNHKTFEILIDKDTTRIQLALNFIFDTTEQDSTRFVKSGSFYV